MQRITSITSLHYVSHNPSLRLQAQTDSNTMMIVALMELVTNIPSDYDGWKPLQ